MTNTVIDVTDRTYIIVVLYNCAPTAEATGYKAGRSISHVGAVGGVDTTSSFETLHDTDKAADVTYKRIKEGKGPITSVAVEGVTLKEDVVSLKKEHRKKSVKSKHLLALHEAVDCTSERSGSEARAVALGYI